jgi:hypothetical protein
VKCTRKLNSNIYSEKKLDLHQRFVNYIIDITGGIDDTYCRQRIRDKAIMYSEKIKKKLVIYEGKETLRVASLLPLIAKQ